LVGIEGEVAAGPVRKSAIVVERVVEKVEGRPVEMNIVDQDIGGVFALRELDKLSDIEERHSRCSAGMLWTVLAAASGRRSVRAGTEDHTYVASIYKLQR